MNVDEFLAARLDEDQRLADTRLRGMDEGVRLLREVEAKREMLNIYREWESTDGSHFSPDYWAAPVERMLAAAALAYCDHPDHDPTWAD